MSRSQDHETRSPPPARDQDSKDRVGGEGKGRGRPRAFDRERALDRATRLFWSKGYEATSMSDLTQAMGIAPTSLYAAFGSKEALYAEALEHYARTSEHLAWGRFDAAPTAREAIAALLTGLAFALTGRSADAPTGCMVTLSTVASEGHAALGDLVRAGRAQTFARLQDRLERAVAEGEVPPSVDIVALSRFFQSVYNGMSILARDGVGCGELTSVVEQAMAVWEAKVRRGKVTTRPRAAMAPPAAS